jgi:protein involved in polysaccharide export with SLBB domain
MRRNLSPYKVTLILNPFLVLVLGLFLISCASGIELSPPSLERNWSPELGPISRGGYYTVTVGDFNGDGIPDLSAGGFQPGGIKVWIGKGDGYFVEADSPLTIAEVRSLRTADFNNDGKVDLVASFIGEERGVAVFLSQGDGRWESPQYLSNKGGFEGLAVGDFDGDGRPDVAAGCINPADEGGIYVWLNKEDGGWLPEKGPRSSGSFRAVASGDLNQDGHLDLVAVQLGLHGALLVWLGDGRGGWSPAVVVFRGNLSGLFLSDVDNDGWLDLIVSLYPRGLAAFFNRKGRIKSEPTIITDNGAFYDVVAGDLDRQPGQEVLASSIVSEGITAFSFLGGSFKRIDLGLPKNNVYYGLFLSDFNLDGFLDIAGGSYDEGIQLWLHTVNGKIKVSDEVISRFSPPVRERELPVLPHLVDENMVFTSKMGFPEYRLASRDEVRIRFFTGVSEKTFDFMVEGDGTIFIPFMELGRLKVAGLSPTELKQNLINILKKFVHFPGVEVNVTKYVGHKVSILGEVKATAQLATGPGRYSLTGKTDLLSFVSEHGGATAQGDISRVRLTRRGKTALLNLFQAISQGDLTQTPILDDGDVVYIPSLVISENRVLVLGEVNNPGIVELRGDTRILDVISRAGSFTKDAKLSQVFVVRGDYLKKPEIVVVNLSKVLKGEDINQNIPLMRDDIVYIPRSFFAKMTDFIKVIHPAIASVYTVYAIKKLSER